jgi:hypothetical protein
MTAAKSDSRHEPDQLDSLELGGRLEEWLIRTIEAYPRPMLPLDREWEVSIAGLARQVPHVPRIATKPLELLDGLGAVHVGPRQVGFDGKEIDWDRVAQIRMQPAWMCFSDVMMEKQASIFASYLPLMPGRKFAARLCMKLFTTLIFAVLPLTDERNPFNDLIDWDTQVVARITYRGRLAGRTTEHDAGAAAMARQLCLPEYIRAITGVAAANGIPVIEDAVAVGATGGAIARAASWRETAQRLRQRFAGGQEIEDWQTTAQMPDDEQSPGA